jgi:hypothetical protein
MRSAFRSLKFDFGNKKHRSIMIPGFELTSVSTSVAFIFLVGRVHLTISLSLAITARRLVNWPTEGEVEAIQELVE